MPEFIVKTTEMVSGTYLVTAETDKAARAKFGGHKLSIDWTGVDQIDYMAFSVEVESVEPA